MTALVGSIRGGVKDVLFWPKADMTSSGSDVRFGPEADVAGAACRSEHGRTPTIQMAAIRAVAQARYAERRGPIAASIPTYNPRSWLSLPLANASRIAVGDGHRTRGALSLNCMAEPTLETPAVLAISR